MSEHPIFQLMEERRYKEAETLFEKEPECVNIQQAGSRFTPLMFAIYRRKLDLAEKMISLLQVNVNLCDDDGWNALHYAGYRNNVAIAKLLLEKGADINRQAEDGRTPLVVAAYQGNSEMIEYLIKKKAEIDHKTESHSFYRYIKKGRCNVSIDFILEHGNFLEEETKREFKALRLERLFA